MVSPRAQCHEALSRSCGRRHCPLRKLPSSRTACPAEHWLPPPPPPAFRLGRDAHGWNHPAFPSTTGSLRSAECLQGRPPRLAGRGRQRRVRQWPRCGARDRLRPHGLRSAASPPAPRSQGQGTSLP
uniref:Uncharacterized protein n=1 Tax=Rousettus aegyptiacus TaxID=9407 RepID=A0A7J8KAA4_ROUAE|nr:hypothetical protein HJG63_007709 [Rousettus aegyptiacus]